MVGGEAISNGLEHFETLDHFSLPAIAIAVQLFLAVHLALLGQGSSILGKQAKAGHFRSL